MHKGFHPKNLTLILAISLGLCAGFGCETFAQTSTTRTPDPPPSEEKESSDKNPKENQEEQAKADDKLTALEKKAFDLLNAERKKDDHPALVWNADLSVVARKHSEAMAKHNFVTIKPFDGRDLRDHIVGAGVKKWLNIGRLVSARANTPKSAEAVIERWLTSPQRRRYVFENRWSETGIGIFISKDGKFYLTQEFLSK